MKDHASDDCPPDTTLLRACSEGRELHETAAPGVRLVIDQVLHDVSMIHLEEPGGKSVLGVCFGWCEPIEGQVSGFKQSTLSAIVARLRTGPDSPAKAAERLTGNFLLIIIDMETSRAFVLTDQWAVRCFYYGISEGKVIVSSRAATIANLIGAPLDGMGWVAGLRGTVLPPQATLFHGVARSLPGQALTADLTTGAVVLTGSGGAFIRRHEPRRFEETVTLLSAAVRSSVRRCATRAPVCVDLTGGNDSRLTAAALHAEDLADKIVFRVTEDPMDDDGRLARQIAAQLGTSIIATPRVQDQVSASFFATASVLSDGHFMSLADARRMWSDRTTYAAFDYHVGSTSGELARDFFWTHEYLRWWSQRKVDLKYLLRRRLYAPWQSRLFAATGLRVTQAEHDEYLLEPFKAICQRVSGASKFCALDLIHVVRSGRRMASVWWHVPSKTIMLPYLTKEFLDVALSSPWWHRVGRRAMLETLWHIDKNMCQIPHDSGVTMRPIRLSSLGAHAVSLLSDFRRKVVLRRQTSTQRARASETVPLEFIARAVELEKDCCFPEQAAGLANWTRTEATNAERVTVIPALIGLGELLSVYSGIRRELCFDHSPFDDFFSDRTLRRRYAAD